MGILKKFFLDLISFNSPLAIVINISFILLFLFLIPTNQLDNLPIFSLYKDFILPMIYNGNCPDSGIFTNCSVYSTGQTHAVSSFMHGDFYSAFRYNKLIFILMSAIFIVLIINIFKMYKQYKKIFLIK